MIDFAALGIVVNPQGAIEQRVPCPQCSKRPRDDALGVNLETGAFHCFRCGWKGRAGGESGAPAPRIARIDDPEIIARKRERLRRTWRETVSLGAPQAHAVRRYLQARALAEVLKAPPTCLRAHPGLEYWDGTRSLGLFPALVALYRGASGRPVTLHVTYIENCAKAPVPSPKKILGVPVRGATRGGCIPLYEPRHGILGVAEGIESALSLGLLKTIPVWSTFCADAMARVHLPEGLRELHVGVDVDASGKGMEVAQRLAARVRKWSPRTKCTLVMPDEGLADLNVELMRKAARR